MSAHAPVSEPASHGLSWEAIGSICAAVGVVYKAMRRLWNASRYLQKIELQLTQQASDITSLKDQNKARDLERALIQTTVTRLDAKVNALLKALDTEFPEYPEQEDPE